MFYHLIPAVDADGDGERTVEEAGTLLSNVIVSFEMLVMSGGIVIFAPFIFSLFRLRPSVNMPLYFPTFLLLHPYSSVCLRVPTCGL